MNGERKENIAVDSKQRAIRKQRDQRGGESGKDTMNTVQVEKGTREMKK